MRSTCTAYIFAGGKSSRMGSDKGLVEWKKQPMLSHVIQRIAPLHLPTVLISSNSEYDQFGLPRIKDVEAGEGPVMGLISAIQHAQTDFILILSCDMPEISTEIIDELVYMDSHYGLVISGDEDGSQQFPARYSKRVLPFIETAYASGERSLRKLNATIPCDKYYLQADARHPEAFVNINSKEELWMHQQ